MFPADLSLILLIFLAAALLMMLIAWVDLKSFRVPDLPVIAIAGLGLWTRYLQHDDLIIVGAVAAIVGLLMFVVAKILEMVRLKPVLGYGDVKLFVAAVIWLKISQLPAFFIMTGVFGVLIALLYMKKKYFPLAPAIATAWILTLIQ